MKKETPADKKKKPPVKKPTTKKHAGGRPTRYKKEYCIQARKLCLLGAIDRDIADFFSVSVQTITSWKQKYPEFLVSLKESKKELDNRVIHSLYERAMGYSHPEDKIFNNYGKSMVVPTTKHYPPDTTAIIFWLKNRQPDEWRDKQITELEIPEDSGVVILKGKITEEEWLKNQKIKKEK